MNDERSTEELINLLGQDCKRCHTELVAAMDAEIAGSTDTAKTDYEFHARQLVRTFFAYIEAVTFSVKASSAFRCMDRNIEISPQERYFAADVEYDLNDRGELIQSTARISLAKNIRFALALNRKALGVIEPFDASIEWWSCLKEGIKIRDRLTHPKMPEDLDISGDEIIKILKAKQGFEHELLRHIDSDKA